MMMPKKILLPKQGNHFAGWQGMMR